MSKKQIALIVGVGAGLGAALARRFSAAGLSVAAAARDLPALSVIAARIGPDVHAYPCDATDEVQVEQLFQSVQEDLGLPDVVIYNAGSYSRKSILKSTKDDVEACWHVTALAGFFVGRAAARVMVDRGHGTILFTGATGSIRGSAQCQNSAIGKFGLRALAQSMARELQPSGVHVAHVIIDGQIESDSLRSILPDRPPDSFLQPDDIAEAYYQVHVQGRGAWSQELDLRSWKESF